MFDGNQTNPGGSHATTIFAFGYGTAVLTFAAIWYAYAYVLSNSQTSAINQAAAAYAITFLGAVNASVNLLCVHDLAPNMTWNEACFWTFLERFLFSIPFVIYEKKVDSADESSSEVAASEETQLLPKPANTTTEDFIQRTSTLVLRGVIACFAGNICPYYGQQRMVPSEAAAIYSTAPFFALLFSWLILGESLGVWIIVCMCFAFAAVLMILRPVSLVSLILHPDFDWNTHHGMVAFAAFIVLLGAMGTGLLGPLMRAMKWGAFEVTCWTGAIGVALIIMLSHVNYMLGFSDAGWSTCWDWAVQNIANQFVYVIAWVLLLGICSFNSSVCHNIAWKLEPAGASDMMRFCTMLVVIFIFQLVVFHEQSDLLAFLGVSIIFLSCISIFCIRTWWQ